MLASARAAGLARFWALALGYVEREPPGVLPNLTFLKVPEGNEFCLIQPLRPDARTRYSIVDLA